MTLGPVVLVEDSWADAELACETLAAAGLENPVLVLRDGNEALAYFRDCLTDPLRTGPALILLDLNLPGIDGRDILSMIKSDADLKKLPLVVVTGAEVELANLGYYGLEPHLAITKPINFAKLARAASAAGAYLHVGSSQKPSVRVFGAPVRESVLAVDEG